MGKYIGAGLATPKGIHVPTAQGVQAIISDVNSFLNRLPEEIKSGRWKDDWDALLDQPKYLINALNEIDKQCPTLSDTSAQ
jgi:hypothetical protein